ncbi:type IV toxin-antitoxin system AbiEi family antitoxin domain-containing protein [Nocardioides sp. zg-ZUI104]|uniref:type IV toxin-antitoxin system AbiEi family antitoxin domain-containing protein n=1 Tax=Nocardioides faecalis TaxID=2803858 RepID=UPI001BD131C0|nr:type IV toxin-antitoxin system AbiEi family antitoxin domain-containing protein [Nocardioides faecalis]MBS4751347.1 type IV toxin-antitoxin system AbiEi family antitoxin domain-containing protein [Nocardioides faecalis]
MSDSPDRLAPLLAMQSGVVARHQLRALGLADHDIARMLRRRLLTRVHPGTYVDHTGPLSWDQRSWAAVLACWPAALAGECARRAADLRHRDSADDGRSIEVVVDFARNLRAPPGVSVRRTRHLRRDVDWSMLPPRQRPEQWVLDLAAAAASELDAVAVVADAVGARRVRPAQLRSALAGRARIRRRGFLAALVEDVAAGTCSALEHGYLHRVERAHGLPAGARQVLVPGRSRAYRDVEYVGLGTIVELDGRMHHSGIPHRDRDMARDLEAAQDDRLTVRLGWGQVYGGQCRTASAVGAILAARGWRGTLRRCPECPDGPVRP